MGLCASAPKLSEEDRMRLENESKMTRMIESAMSKEQKEEEAYVKLLLLGTGESGKSTLFKQLVQIYGSGYNEDARMPYASIVHTNCILGMKTLIKQSEVLSKQDQSLELSPQLIGSKNYIMNEVKADAEVDREVAKHIKLLWADPAIKKTFDQRSKFQLSDSVSYFFDKIDEVGAERYIPTYQDILHVRARTTGIVETTFVIQNNKFKMFDVGGQRNERKKWIHCFEKVNALIFVAAINEYDQKLYEDGVTNRIYEALELFGEICNSRWFRETSMILFLNKRDLFREKIAKVDLKGTFDDYDGGADYDRAVAFLTDKFLKKNDFSDRKQVYVHVTCATDSQNIQFTFNAVKDIILKDRLKECGLLD